MSRTTLLEILWSIVAAVLGIVTFASSTNVLEGVPQSAAVWVVPSVLVYLLGTRSHRFLKFLTLGVRRRPLTDLLVTLGGGQFGYLLATHLGIPGTWLEPVVFVVAALVLYVVTIVATPDTGVATVNCPASDCFEDGKLDESDDQKSATRPSRGRPVDQALVDPEKKLALLNDSKATHYPFVWPYILAAHKGGSAVWRVEGDGELGYTLEIDFNQKFFPFGSGRRLFKTQVPGTIAAGPIVQSGSGEYTLRLKDANGTIVQQVDPAFVVPPG